MTWETFNGFKGGHSKCELNAGSKRIHKMCFVAMVRLIVLLLLITTALNQSFYI